MKKLTKILSLVMAVSMLVCLAACGSSKPAAPAQSGEKTLTIATSPDFPPFEYLEGSDVVGIEIDIMQKICDKIGRKLVIEQMDFDSVLPGIQAKKFDVGVSGITVTEERQKNALFTQPYCLAAQAIIVVEGSPITCKADLEGKTVSVQTGTTAESFCMDSGYSVSSFAANNDAEMALTNGKVDAWVIDDLTGADMVAAYNKTAAKKLVVLDEAMTTEPYAFALALGNEELLKEVDAALSELIADGSVAAAFEKFNAPFTAPDKG